MFRGKGVLCILAGGALAAPSSAAIITQWNFNGTAAGATAPNLGTGSASLVGGTTATFASGDASGGSSDPAVGSPPDFGWNTTTYPAASVANESAGVQFMVSTVGMGSVGVSWDQRHSNTVSRYWAFYYTTDGATWNRLSVNAGNATAGMTPTGGNPANIPGLFGPAGTFSGFDESVAGSGDDWFNGRGVNLSSVAGVANNPNFGFRIVSSFGGGTTYLASSAGTYATTGTARFDMVTVSGSPVPEPASLAVVGLGLITLLRRRSPR